MNRDAARERLLQVSKEHEHDRDGGYSLADALKRACEEVAPEERGVFAQALGDFVRGQDAKLWGVALEALVQLGEQQEVASLASDVRSPAHSLEWKDNVVLSLLRLRQGQFRELIVQHVRDSLGSPRTLTVPLVAALCRVDRGACLENAVSVFDDAYATGRNVEGLMPAFVLNFTEVDEGLIAELVLRLSARRVEAGRWLAERFDVCLSKPWMNRQLGSDRVGRLHRELVGAAGGWV